MRADLDDVFAGHGRVVLVGGEPGVGKTRLVEELQPRRRARRRRRVEPLLRGPRRPGLLAVDPGRPRPRSLSSTTDVLRAALGQRRRGHRADRPGGQGAGGRPGTGRADRSRVRPVPALPGGGGVPEPAVGASPGGPRHRRPALGRPVVDAARRLPGVDHRRRPAARRWRTYRSVDPTLSPPLHGTLAELARQATFRRVDLEGLDEDGLASCSPSPAPSRAASSSTPSTGARAATRSS